MSRKITITADDIQITARLLEEQNPELCKLFWEMLPYKSLTLHTVVAGNNIFHNLPNPYPYPPENVSKVSRVKAPQGTIFYPVPKHIFINYGKNVEERNFPPIAQVLDKDLDKLEQIGKACWQATYHKSKKPLFITASKYGASTRDIKTHFSKLIDPTSIKHPFIQKLISDINQAIKATWLQPSQEIVDLYSGAMSQKTGMGSHGQYFGTLFNANAEMRCFGAPSNLGFWDAMLKALQYDDLDFKTLSILYKDYITHRAGFLKMCNMHTFADFLHRSLQSFEYIENKETFIALFSTLALYGEQNYSWGMQYFPWKAKGELIY